MMWKLTLMAAVIAGCSGQNLIGWCPNFVSDLNNCTQDLVSQLSSVGSLVSNVLSILDVGGIMSKEPAAICSDSGKVVFKNFYRCFYKMVACIPSEWRKAFPTIDQMLTSIDYWCDNIDDIDLVCIIEQPRLTSLQNCLDAGASGLSGSDQSTVDGYQTFVCGNMSLTGSCYKTAFDTCPKRTVEVVIKGYKLQTPIGCNACAYKPATILIMVSLILMFVCRWQFDQ